MQRTSANLEFTPINNVRLANLCGPCNEIIDHIEGQYDVEIHQRSNTFSIHGQPDAVNTVNALLHKLYQQTREGKPLTLSHVNVLLRHQPASKIDQKTMRTTTIKTHTKSIAPLTLPQAKYIKDIRSHPINFAIGPAGTGKTYLAVACAVEALEKGSVNRLVFVRPAVEAGEKLGFLPGDMEEKVLPYLRPIYDALYEMLGFDHVQKLIERKTIEIAPLAFMRGRTLSDAFIILDEAQNTTVMQMKMFLTRLGYGSTAVACGDVSQIDLPREIASGLQHALEIMSNISEISVNTFQAKDAVRHPLVRQIIEAYESNHHKR